MVTAVSSLDTSLLSLCALLRWFDRDLLAALAGLDDSHVASLLASDPVTPDANLPGVYTLPDDIRSRVLADLHATRPFDLLDWQVRAFEYFIQRMGQAEAPSRRHEAEARGFYHLNRIFMFLSPRLEWQAITRYSATARAAASPESPHLRWLDLYDAFVAVRTGEYERGEPVLRWLLEQPGLDDEIYLISLLGLGQMQRNLTHYDQALAIYDRLSARACELGNQPYHGVALINKGSIYTELDMYDRALALVQESLRIFEQHHDLERTAYAHYSLGLNAMHLGRWLFAQEHYAAAIQLFEKLHMGATLATSYWSQGFLHHMLGNEAASEAAYLRAIQLIESSQRGEPLVAMDSHLGLGFLYATQGCHDQALIRLQQANDLASQLRHEHRTSRIHYLRGKVLQAQGRREAALIAYGQAIASIETLRSAHRQEDIKISVLGTTQQIFEAMVLLCIELGRDAEAFEYVERARSRAFLDTLAPKSPELCESFDRPVVTLAEVQAHLPEHALLVEYFTTGVIPRGEHIVAMLPQENTRLRAHLVLPPRVVIFAATRDHVEIHQATLDPNKLRPQINDRGPGRRLLQHRLPIELYERLIGPVRHLFEGRDLVYLIPHGPLHYVPFNALRAPDGGYLLDQRGPALAWAPSATVLLRNCLSQPPARAAEFLALGYNALIQRSNGVDSERLRHAENEARLMARAMGGPAWAGAEPKSRRLAEAAPRLRWLHIAGHAVYDPHDPLDSYLQLGADDRLSARQIMEQLRMPADLVTLSACTTGLTHVVPGDELLGLQRAFLYAGVSTIICTLWEAADLVALLVMERFYNGLRGGQAPAAALRDAQIALRDMTGRELHGIFERWRAETMPPVDSYELPSIPAELYDIPLYADPLYWAPFMLIGRPE